MEPRRIRTRADHLLEHRADVLGSGRPQLVVSPLNRTTEPGVRLTAFSIPAEPRTESWPRTVIDDTLNRMHNHWHSRLGNNPDFTLTASREGIHLFTRSKAGMHIVRLAPKTRHDLDPGSASQLRCSLSGMTGRGGCAVQKKRPSSRNARGEAPSPYPGFRAGRAEV